MTTPSYQSEGHPPQIEIVPGALSTPGIDYELVPPIVWERLAKRFMLGEERKGDKAWNADSKNQDILSNKKFILNRLGHTIAHCLKLMDKVRRDADLTSDDDAAAIAWGGAFAICATDALAVLADDTADAIKKVMESAASSNYVKCTTPEGVDYIKRRGGL